MSVLLYIHLKNEVFSISLPFPLNQCRYLSSWFSNCMQKSVTFVSHRWSVGFQKPKTILFTKISFPCFRQAPHGYHSEQNVPWQPWYRKDNMCQAIRRTFERGKCFFLTYLHPCTNAQLGSEYQTCPVFELLERTHKCTRTIMQLNCRVLRN